MATIRAKMGRGGHHADHAEAPADFPVRVTTRLHTGEPAWRARRSTKESVHGGFIIFACFVRLVCFIALRGAAEGRDDDEHREGVCLLHFQTARMAARMTAFKPDSPGAIAAWRIREQAN